MLTVAEVADALEDCVRTRSLKAKQEVLRGLFTKCGSDAAAIDTLLRVLLPNEVNLTIISTCFEAYPNNCRRRIEGTCTASKPEGCCAFSRIP